MAKKTKVIIVIASGGRTGSSALMGLLALSGISPGGYNTGLRAAKKNNPKGFFEITTWQTFLATAYGKSHPHIGGTPTIDTIESIVANKHNTHAMRTILQKEYRTDPVICIKDAMGLLTPYFSTLQASHTVKCLVCHREINDQANSVAKLSSKSRNTILANITRVKNLRDSIIARYSCFDYHHVQFNQLITQPVITYNTIAKFANFAPISNEQIESWIDPKLVHSNEKS